MPSLEILDVSRNRLRALPPDLGTLMNLKVGEGARGGGGWADWKFETGAVDVEE